MGSIFRRKWKDRKSGSVRESAVWWIKYYRGGRPIRESAETENFTDAKQLLKQREGDVARGVPIVPRMGRMKFREFADDLLNDYRVNGRRSLRDLQIRLDKHVLPFFGERRAGAITTAEIRQYVTARLAAEASNGQINRELAAVKRAFALAAQAGKVAVRPHVPMLKENNVRTGFFERDQFEAVRKHLPEPLQAVAMFAYNTGWRTPSEVQQLQWPQVDFQAGTVRLEPGTTKNDEARVFPFTAELRALLEAQRAKVQALQREKGIICPWVFFWFGRGAGKRVGKPIRYFRRSWKTACKAAGLPGRIPHDFRRTAVRNLVRAGIPERVAMMMTGHKTRSVFERYNIVSEGDLLAAARRLDDFAGTNSGTNAAADQSRQSLSVRK